MQHFTEQQSCLTHLQRQKRATPSKCYLIAITGLEQFGTPNG